MNITIQDLSHSFTTPQAASVLLHNISLNFPSKSTTAIAGISGSGKTTLLSIISGLMHPTSGTVQYGDSNIFDVPDHKRSHYLGLVFQDPHLITEFTVEENCMLIGLLNGYTRTACIPRVHELLEMLQLREYAARSVHELSGGQRQRIAIARALFMRPTWLIADEPTGNLDETTGNSIIETLIACQQTYGMGLIVSSHDPRVIACMEYRYTLHKGSLYRA